MSNISGFVKRIRDIMRNDAGINGDAQRIEQLAWMLFLKVYDSKENDWEFNEDDYVSIIPETCRWRNWAHEENGRGMTGDALLNFVNNTLFPVLKGKDVKDGNGNVLIRGVQVDATTPIKKAIVKTTFEDANNYMKDGVLLRQLVNVIDDLKLDDYEESHAFGEIYESILRELQSAGSAGEFYTPRAVTDFMAQMIQPQIGEKAADFACGTGGFLTSWLKELGKKVQTVEDVEKLNTSIYGIEKKQFPYMLCITNMLLHDLDMPAIYHDNSLLKNVLDYTDKDRFDVILMNPPYGGSEKADVKNHFPDDLASSETADLFMSVIMYRLKQNGRAAVILPDGFLFGLDNAKVNIKKKLLSEFNLHTVIRLPGSVFSPYTSITTNILFFDNTGETEQTWFYRLDMPDGYKHFSKTKPMKLEHFAPVIEWWNNRQALSVDGFDKSRCFTYKEMTEDLGYNLDQCGFPHEEEEILDPRDLIQRYEEERASLNAEIDRVLSDISALLGGKTE
ncbi:MAG: SAM-dependent DNA methyltransferase [Clostridia bacterium]|nr:SAM-dependent DNA methyltransferase [Clostridia bacterium]